MYKADAKEADQIVRRLLNNLLGIILDKELPGITAKATCGWVIANSLQLCASDQIGIPLDTCFDQVRQAGATLQGMETVRLLTNAEKPKTVGATVIRDRAVQMALAHSAKIISTMRFTSRQDVNALLKALQIPYNSAEQVAANSMEGIDYMAVVQLRAAIVNYLVSTARPLPSMLQYQFAKSYPSLIISYRLYGDASRYDEIRDENKVVHPAFCRSSGWALSQ